MRILILYCYFHYYLLMTLIIFYLVAPRVLCEGSAHLISYTLAIIENNGEGVILRKIQSRYERGRTSSLVKFKVFSLLINLHLSN